MMSIGALWLAILVSGVLVWIASALVWMVLPHHKTDFRKLPDEDAARAALTPQNITPGQYTIPHCPSPAAMKDPDIRKMFEEGPVGFVTITQRGLPSMGKAMGLTFVFYLLVGVVVAYVSSRTVTVGGEYLEVFRVAGTVAFVAHGMAIIPDAIWFGRPWANVAKHLFDALVYGLLTGGVFGWLWPQG